MVPRSGTSLRNHASTNGDEREPGADQEHGLQRVDEREQEVVADLGGERVHLRRG